MELSPQDSSSAFPTTQSQDSSDIPQNIRRSDKVFKDRLEELKKFQKDKSHLQVPKGSKLGNWLRNLRSELLRYKEGRSNKKPISKWQQDKLEQIGFMASFNLQKKSQYFQFLLKYAESFRE